MKFKGFEEGRRREEVTSGEAEEEKPETGDLRPEAGKKSNEWERTSQMTAEDLSGVVAGG